MIMPLSHLLDFISFLHRSRNRPGRIKAPPKTLRETKKYLSSRPIISINIVEGIVEAIDDEKSAICSRLDLQGFLLVYEVLSLTEECLAYQRGLFLLAQSLRESPASLPERDLQTTKKEHLGKNSLMFLVGCFVGAELSQRTRRWMGILAWELLQGSHQNKELLLKAPKNTWRRLGDLVFDGTCKVLRLIAGIVIREMWPEDTPTKELWPAPHDPEIHRRFPRANHQNSQWIIDFEDFASSMVPQNLTISGNPEVVLAYAVSVGEMTYCVDSGSTILVTVSDELNIVIPASSTSSTMCIDITIDQIHGVSSGIGSSLSKSDSALADRFQVLTVWMSRSSEQTFYFNALRQSADSINLAFTSPKAAAIIQQGLGSRITNCLRASQSEPINISRYFLEELDESPAAHPARLFSDGLVNAASKASALLEQNSEASVNQVSRPKDDRRNKLDYLSQSRLDAPSSPRDIMRMQQRKAYVDRAMSPIQPHQFDEVGADWNLKPHFEADGMQHPTKKLDDDSPLESSPAAQAQICTHIESPLVQPNENHGSPSYEANSDFLNDPKGQSIELSPGLDDSFKQARPAKVVMLHYSQSSPKPARKAKTPPSPPSRRSFSSRAGSRDEGISRKIVTDRTPSKKKKAGRNKSDHLFSTKKAHKTRKVETGPLPLAQSRKARAAALSAKDKIQGIMKSESSENIETLGSSLALLEDESKEYLSPGYSDDQTQNSGTSLMVFKNNERQTPDNGKKRRSTEAFSEVTSGSEEIPSSRSAHDDDLLPNGLVQKETGYVINIRKGKPAIARDLPFTRINQAQGTASKRSHKTQKFIHPRSISNLKSVSPFNYADEVCMSGEQTSDDANILDSIGGGFFEEAIAFSHEEAKNDTEKPNKQKNPDTPVCELKDAIAQDPNPRDNSTIVSIAAKLQSALSSIINLRSKCNQQGLPKMKALTSSDLIATPHTRVPEKIPPAYLSLKDIANPDRKKRPPLGLRSDNHTPVSKSNKIDNVNKAPDRVVRKPFEGFKKLNEGQRTIHDTEIVKTPLDVDRKCNIIGFDSQGPRNQGMLSSRKPRRGVLPEGGSPEFSSRVHTKTLKRKSHDLFEGKLQSGDHQATAKRPRKHMGVIHTREETSIPVHKRTSSTRISGQKASSQSTRVDENGSPLPFVHSRKLGLKGYQPHISARAVSQENAAEKADGGDHDYTRLESRPEDLQPNVSFLQAPTSRASVQCISSPNAPPWAIHRYTAHKVSPSGKFVDAQMNDVIMTIGPSDPFVELQLDPPNDFVDMLRRTPNNRRDSKGHVQAAAINEDADKTLVGASSVQSKDGSRIASRTSLSLDSTPDSSYSGDNSPPEEPLSSEGGDGGEDEWAVSLQPHQGETLEALYDISLSVVRNLVSKENAVRDLASDYSRDGNRVIDELERSHQQDLFAYHNSISTLKGNLVARYQKAQRELEVGLIGSLQRKSLGSNAWRTDK